MRDKVVVVTGGFGVLGHAVAEAALAAGAFVAVLDREQPDKIATRDRLLVPGGVDLADFAAVEPGDKVFARGTQEYARSGGHLRQGAA